MTSEMAGELATEIPTKVTTEITTDTISHPNTAPGTQADPPTNTRSTPPRPPRLPTPLRTELRRGIAPWAGLAVMVTLAVPMLPKASQWQGSWGETQNLLHSAAALLAGPLVAAAGCWQGGRERRRGLTELRESTVRTPLAQSLLCLAPLLLWVLAGYAAAAAAVLLATWPYAPSGNGSPLVSMAATDATWLGTAAVLGFVAGRLIRWRLAAPVIAALMYVAVGVPSYVSSNAQFLTPAAGTEADTHLPVWWQGPVMVLWLGGLGVAALLAYAARRRATALVPLAAALAAATLITQTGYGMWQKTPVASRVVCGGSEPKTTKAPKNPKTPKTPKKLTALTALTALKTPQICVTGLDGVLLPQITKALAGLTSRLEGVEGAPVTYLDQRQNPKAHEGEAALPYAARGGGTQGGGVVRNKLVDPGEYARETVRLLLWRECSGEAFDEGQPGADRLRLLDATVQAWLAPGGSPAYGPAPDAGGLSRLRAMGDEERRQWLGRYLTTRKSCTPAEVPVL